MDSGKCKFPQYIESCCCIDWWSSGGERQWRDAGIPRKHCSTLTAVTKRRVESLAAERCSKSWGMSASSVFGWKQPVELHLKEDGLRAPRGQYFMAPVTVLGPDAHPFLPGLPMCHGITGLPQSRDSAFPERRRSSFERNLTMLPPSGS